MANALGVYWQAGAFWTYQELTDAVWVEALGVPRPILVYFPYTLNLLGGQVAAGAYYFPKPWLQVSLEVLRAQYSVALSEETQPSRAPFGANVQPMVRVGLNLAGLRDQ